jgi:hypothetical protein
VADFFIPIAMDPVFQEKAAEWIADQEQFPWDTSVFKVIDNLIIGSQREMAVL